MPRGVIDDCGHGHYYTYVQGLFTYYVMTFWAFLTPLVCESSEHHNFRTPLSVNSMIMLLQIQWILYNFYPHEHCIIMCHHLPDPLVPNCDDVICEQPLICYLLPYRKMSTLPKFVLIF